MHITLMQLLIDATETCPAGTTDVGGSEIKLNPWVPSSSCPKAYMVYQSGRTVKPHLRACRLQDYTSNGGTTRTWPAGGFGDLTFDQDMVGTAGVSLNGYKVSKVMTQQVTSKLTIDLPQWAAESGIPAIRGIAIR